MITKNPLKITNQKPSHPLPSPAVLLLLHKEIKCIIIVYGVAGRSTVNV